MSRAMLLVLAACSGGGTGTAAPDARGYRDAPAPDSAPPYRHTITLDGIDDFTSGETFATTSTAFSARIAWDDTHLFIGYAGPDLATNTSDAPQKWLFVYVDTIATGGQAQSEQYNTQRATFPAGFAADYYVRYKVNGTLESLEQDVGGDWMTATPAPEVAQAGTFVELSIPLASITAGTSLSLVTYMINEKMFSEGTYAGLFMDNFVDGYAMNLTITRTFTADFTASRMPAE
jgi:hypothetical protein